MIRCIHTGGFISWANMVNNAPIDVSVFACVQLLRYTRFVLIVVVVVKPALQWVVSVENNPVRLSTEGIKNMIWDMQQIYSL